MTFWQGPTTFRVRRFVQKIGRLFKRNDPDPTPRADSTVGLGAEGLETHLDPYFEMSMERYDIYDDMEVIDHTVPEGQRALSILADNAVASDEGSDRYFQIVFDEEGRVSQANQAIIKALLERVGLPSLCYSVARDMLKYGDNFQQICVGSNFKIMRLMCMPPSSMMRKEDAQGRLKRGRKQGEFAYEQYEPRTDQFIAGFLPWQIYHLRWEHSGTKKYGTALLNAARPSWKKLQSMEEALVVNWLTRAFARLLFELDTTGKTPLEAEAYVNEFMRRLNRRPIADNKFGLARMTVAKDLALGMSYSNRGGKWVPSLNKISVLDTSNTGFWNITGIEYFRNKFVGGTGVPKAHLGLEKDINAKATLQWQDMRFVRLVRRVQSLMTEFVRYVIDLEFILHGVNPREVDYTVQWDTPDVLDAVTRSEALKNNALAAQALAGLGLLDVEWFAREVLKMTKTQADRLPKQPILQQPVGSPAQDDSEDDEYAISKGNGSRQVERQRHPARVR
jgi:hypothetical protein